MALRPEVLQPPFGESTEGSRDQRMKSVDTTCAQSVQFAWEEMPGATHCHSTLVLTAIDCHWLSFLRDLCSSLAVIAVILLSNLAAIAVILRSKRQCRCVAPGYAIAWSTLIYADLHSNLADKWLSSSAKR
jgi:hypothetical protein